MCWCSSVSTSILTCRDVPLVLDYAKTDEQKQILQLVLARQPLGRPFFAPPGIPADRADALRKAFMATMSDPQFLAAAQKSKLEINPLSGADVAALVNVFTTVSPAAVARTKRSFRAINVPGMDQRNRPTALIVLRLTPNCLALVCGASSFRDYQTSCAARLLGKCRRWTK